MARNKSINLGPIPSYESQLDRLLNKPVAHREIEQEEQHVIGHCGGLLVTDYDTHSPAKWASVLLDEMVPTSPKCTIDALIKIGAAKDALRPHVIAMIADVRNAERKAYLSFDEDDNAAALATYKNYHGIDAPNGQHWHTLHKEVKKSKLRSSADWADRHVQAICRVAGEIQGNIGSNAMREEMYRIIDKWLTAVQLAERSHHVTSNQMHLSNR